MVLKPSELTPFTALELGDIANQVGLPAGVSNNVTGFGSEAGQSLTDHPGVDKLAFTGQIPTGPRIMATATRDIKTISLQLGGKSLLVIFAGTPIDAAVEWIMFVIFWNQGELCSATSRVLVEEGDLGRSNAAAGRGSAEDQDRPRTGRWCAAWPVGQPEPTRKGPELDQNRKT